MCCACQHDVSTKFNILLHASFNQLLLNMMQSLDEELCTVSCQKHGTKPKFSNKSVRTSPFFLMCSPSLHCLFAFPAKKNMEVKIQQVNWVAKTVSQTRKLNPFRVKGGATQFTFAVTKKKNKFKRHRLKKNVLSSHPLLDVAAVRGPSGSAFSCHCH